MKVRIIQLINNFYIDQDQNSDAAQDQNSRRQLGEYCSFGYFDAVCIEESQSVKNIKESAIWEKINQTVCDAFDAFCSRRNLICIIDNAQKDQEFWEDAKKYPYIFISLVRTKHREETTKKIKKIVQIINADKTAIAYYSYNHSEIIIVKLESTYTNGLCFVLDKRKKIDLLNMYSIFSVRENMLNNANNINNEKIEVRLHIMVKDDELIQTYLEKLVDQIGIINGNYKTYNTLGSCDLLFEIKEIDLKNLLPCYAMGNILTHSNSFFQKAVFNIETEFIVESEILEHCRIGQTKR